MALFFIFVAVLFIVPAVRGKGATDELLDLLKGDFTGKNNFLIWGMALALIAMIGSVDKLRPFSRVFLGLVFLAVFVANYRGPNNNIIADFLRQIGATTAPKGSTGSMTKINSALSSLN